MPVASSGRKITLTRRPSKLSSSTVYSPCRVGDYIQNVIIAYDAILFHNPKLQFEAAAILREINKAHVAFDLRPAIEDMPIATGHWGCGVFNGDKQLKAIIQIMAAAVAKRDLHYYCFKDLNFSQELEETVEILKGRTVADVWNVLAEFDIKKHSHVFKFVRRKFSDQDRVASMEATQSLEK